MAERKSKLSRREAVVPAPEAHKYQSPEAHKYQSPEAHKYQSPAAREETSTPARHYGVRGISALLAPVLRPAYRRRAPAAAHLLADWETLAGPALAARAAPVKFAGGTLTLGCPGPVAMELQLVGPQIIERLNLALGHAMIERLRFEQRAPVIRPIAARGLSAEVPPPPSLPEGPLGDALARLHHGLMSRR